MGHSDPQILLGFSQGAILIYRIRAHVYSYKASRIRVPVDLSEFTEFPGCEYQRHIRVVSAHLTNKR